MDHYAIIGNPVEHSRSPKIHRLFAEQLQHVLAYEKIEATEKTFQEKVEEFFTKGGKGINITVPFKRLAFSISDKLGVCASSCGAVNTLSFSEDGRVYGESTDGNGLVEDLKNNNIAINNKSILIVGAGGLGLMGVQVAKALTKSNIICADLDDKKLNSAKELGATHIINTKEPDAVKKIMSICNEKGVDSIVDFVNAPSTVKMDLSLIRKRGNIILVGLFGGAVELPLVSVPLKAITIQGAYTGNYNDMIELIKLAQDGVIKPIVCKNRQFYYRHRIC